MARKKARDLSKTISKAVEHHGEVKPIVTPQTEPSQAKPEEVIVATATIRGEEPISKLTPVSTRKKKKKVSKEMGRPAMEEPRYRFSATLTDINKKYLKFLANKHNCKISDIINNTFADMLDKDKRVDRKFLESNY